MKPNTALTPDRLRRCLSYDPAAGTFFWRASLGPGRRHLDREAGKIVQGYRRVFVDGKSYAAQRLAWLYMTGAWPMNDVDHQNGNTLDNRWANLRDATRTQNNGNRTVKLKRKRASLKGATWDSARLRWAAYITFRGKQTNLGRFDIEEDAHAAYMSAAARLFGEFARAA